MKILVVSQYYTPDITAAAFRISETVNYLREFGHQVKVITAFPNKIDSTKQGVEKCHDIHRVKLPDTEDKGFWGYIYLYLNFLMKSIAKGYGVGRKQNPDVIWASSPPIFVGLAGWFIAKVLRAKFVLDIRDIWPDSAVAARQISNSGIAYKIGSWLEVFLYNHADVITCVAAPMKDYIKEQTGNKIEIIYNGGEVPVSEKESTGDKLRRIKNSESAKTLLYAGNFGHVQQLEILINVFADIDRSDLKNDWEIFFLGGGVKEKYLRELVEAKGMDDRIHFLNPVPKAEAFDYLRSADFLFIHLQPNEVLRLTIPSKVFDYMIAARPILAGIHGEGREIINSVEGNITFRSGNKKSLKKAIKKMDESIFQNGVICNTLGVNRKYSRERQSRKLHKVLEKTVL